MSSQSEETPQTAGSGQSYLTNSTKLSSKAKMLQLKCPLKCGSKLSFKNRTELESHLKQECGEVTVACTFRCSRSNFNCHSDLLKANEHCNQRISELNEEVKALLR